MYAGTNEFLLCQVQFLLLFERWFCPVNSTTTNDLQISSWNSSCSVPVSSLCTVQMLMVEGCRSSSHCSQCLAQMLLALGTNAAGSSSLCAALDRHRVSVSSGHQRNGWLQLHWQMPFLLCSEASLVLWLGLSEVRGMPSPTCTLFQWLRQSQWANTHCRVKSVFTNTCQFLFSFVCRNQRWSDRLARHSKCADFLCNLKQQCWAGRQPQSAVTGALQS